MALQQSARVFVTARDEFSDISLTPTRHSILIEQSSPTPSNPRNTLPHDTPPRPLLPIPPHDRRPHSNNPPSDLLPPHSPLTRLPRHPHPRLQRLGQQPREIALPLRVAKPRVRPGKERQTEVLCCLADGGGSRGREREGETEV